ncbi:hypothetical protein YC2023_017276 [Brassica napus]
MLIKVIEDWELSRLELGLQGSKEQRQESLQILDKMLEGNKFQEALKLSGEARSEIKLDEEYEAEKVISQDIARRCRGCRKVQGVAEVEQVCLITGEKLKRR